MVDMNFGTGVMTITPWHSHEDFVLAEKYKLDKEQIIDKYGRLLPVAGEFSEMKIVEAREKIIEKLKKKSLVLKEEDYTNNVATAERTGGFIEPQILSMEWIREFATIVMLLTVGILSGKKLYEKFKLITKNIPICGSP